MQCINASHWPLIVKGPVAEVYCSGTYPGDTPTAWRNHHKPFACVRYHHQSNTLNLWRDHFGLEPLYYYYDPQYCIFGSSLPAIIAFLSKHPTLNTTRVLIECFAKEQVQTPNYSNETFYTGIYRVEPGHCLTIHNGQMHQEAFWTLDPEAPSLYYANAQDYLEHFNQLLIESIQSHHDTKLAIEFSGGLDSSAIITCCEHLGLKPALFSHSSDDPATIDLAQMHCLIAQLKLTNVHYLDAKNFDPIEVFQQMSSVFAGAPCYVFFMLANNIHQAVATGGYTTLLSGFGGDECVSGYARNISFFPDLLRNQHYYRAWQEMLSQLQKGTTITPPKIKIFLNLLRYVNPSMFKLFSKMDDLRGIIKAYASSQPVEAPLKSYAYHPSVRHFEHSQLQGRLSRHLRMRIEYSAVLAKHFGFTYAYPLLHPKLVEFCFHLPAEQKKRHGMGRYLMRQYLAQYLPDTISAHNSKRGDIVPATRHKYLQYLKEGKLAAYFNDLPFEQHIHQINPSRLQPFARILAYMFQHYCANHGVSLA